MKNVAINQPCIQSFSHDMLLVVFFKAHLEIYFRHMLMKDKSTKMEIRK